MDFRVPAGESSSVRRVMVIGTVTRERTKSARILLKFPHPCALCRSRSRTLAGKHQSALKALPDAWRRVGQGSSSGFSADGDAHASQCDGYQTKSARHAFSRDRSDGGGGRGSVSPDSRLAPLLRSLDPGHRALVRRAAACCGAVAACRRVLSVHAPEPRRCHRATACMGRAVYRRGRLSAVRRHRQSQAAATPSGALRGRAMDLRSRLEWLQPGIAGHRLSALAPRPGGRAIGLRRATSGAYASDDRRLRTSAAGGHGVVCLPACGPLADAAPGWLAVLAPGTFYLRYSTAGCGLVPAADVLGTCRPAWAYGPASDIGNVRAHCADARQAGELAVAQRAGQPGAGDCHTPGLAAGSCANSSVHRAVAGCRGALPAVYDAAVSAEPEQSWAASLVAPALYPRRLSVLLGHCRPGSGTPSRNLSYPFGGAVPRYRGALDSEQVDVWLRLSA